MENSSFELKWIDSMSTPGNDFQIVTIESLEFIDAMLGILLENYSLMDKQECGTGKDATNKIKEYLSNMINNGAVSIEQLRKIENYRVFGEILLEDYLNERS